MVLASGVWRVFTTINYGLKEYRGVRETPGTVLKTCPEKEGRKIFKIQAHAH